MEENQRETWRSSARRVGIGVGAWRGRGREESAILIFEMYAYRFYKDDLDHDRQLTRSKHEAHGGEDNHLATAMDP
jgi:hypothetical protein